ncbi:MAG TPA: sensor domain-containing protein [Gaiellaceae bacterium]|nr:sensor domain-containing protein [Gaiellaceae bacterium]
MRVPAAFTEPFRLRTWRETAYAIVSLPLGVLWFSVFLTLLTTSLSLIVFVVGLPLLALTLWAAWAAAIAQRSVAGALLRVGIPEPPLVRTEGARPFRRFLDPMLQLSAWRALAYLLLFAFPLGLASFLVAVIMWSLALGFLTAPAWYFFIPEAERGDVFWSGNHVDSGWEWGAIVGLGVFLLFLTPWLVRAFVSLDALLMRALLGPTRGELERAAARSAEQRDLAVAAASGDRRQIERDLHDGAQARLVSLAVDLGRARRRLEEGGSQEEAAELVRSAHEEAKLALSEIRDLARGIHPAVLTDRGLDAALSSLAARSAVPVALRSELGAERAPEQVESAAYFVVAEALTNVARHSEATHAAVSVVRDDGALLVEVRDDGVGGAEAAPGSGLAGLSDRVGALGGSLVVDSPPGGPTAITAVLPCA